MSNNEKKVVPEETVPMNPQMNPPSYGQSQPAHTNFADGSRRGNWLLSRPKSSNTRIIIDFFPNSCCGDPMGLSDEDVNNVPPALVGVEPAEWTKRMTQLRDIAKGRLSTMTDIALCVLVIGIPFVLGKNYKSQKLIKKWMDDFNEQVLAPKGYYLKTQTSSVSIDDYHEEISWLAISLTPEDAGLLKKEEHMLYMWPCTGKHVPCSCWTVTWQIFCCCGCKQYV